jgi:hypothetical protein
MGWPLRSKAHQELEKEVRPSVQFSPETCRTREDVLRRRHTVCFDSRN